MTLVIFLMGNNLDIDDEGGGQKGHFCDDVICERSLMKDFISNSANGYVRLSNE